MARLTIATLTMATLLWLFSLLSHYVFTRLNTRQVIVAIASGATPSLSEATPASDAFHAFLAAALVKDPI